jgi:hypothetical protein
MAQCKGLTNINKRCRRIIHDGDYCNLHSPSKHNEEEPRSKRIERYVSIISALIVVLEKAHKYVPDFWVAIEKLIYMREIWINHDRLLEAAKAGDFSELKEGAGEISNAFNWDKGQYFGHLPVNLKNDILSASESLLELSEDVLELSEKDKKDLGSAVLAAVKKARNV